jgi:hypothetical protein
MERYIGFQVPGKGAASGAASQVTAGLATISQQFQCAPRAGSSPMLRWHSKWLYYASTRRSATVWRRAMAQQEQVGPTGFNLKYHAESPLLKGASPGPATMWPEGSGELTNRSAI